MILYKHNTCQKWQHCILGESNNYPLSCWILNDKSKTNIDDQRYILKHLWRSPYAYSIAKLQDTQCSDIYSHSFIYTTPKKTLHPSQSPPNTNTQTQHTHNHSSTGTHKRLKWKTQGLCTWTPRASIFISCAEGALRALGQLWESRWSGCAGSVSKGEAPTASLYTGAHGRDAALTHTSPPR